MKSKRVFAAACGLLLAAAVHAHGFLERAEPRIGSTVKAAPAEVRIWFSEPLEGAFSNIEVKDAEGHAVHAARAKVDEHDAKQIHVPLKPIGPGTYTAKWRAVSRDTHVTEGHFVFHVAH